MMMTWTGPARDAREAVRRAKRSVERWGEVIMHKEPEPYTNGLYTVEMEVKER